MSIKVFVEFAFTTTNKCCGIVGLATFEQLLCFADSWINGGDRF